MEIWRFWRFWFWNVTVNGSVYQLLPRVVQMLVGVYLSNWKLVSMRAFANAARCFFCFIKPIGSFPNMQYCKYHLYCVNLRLFQQHHMENVHKMSAIQFYRTSNAQSCSGGMPRVSFSQRFKNPYFETLTFIVLTPEIHLSCKLMVYLF